MMAKDIRPMDDLFDVKSLWTALRQYRNAHTRQDPAPISPTAEIYHSAGTLIGTLEGRVSGAKNLGPNVDIPPASTLLFPVTSITYC